MPRPSHALRISIVALPALFATFVACNGDDGPPSGGGGAPLATSAPNGGGAHGVAAALPELTIPANTILPDAAGVLAPSGNGSMSVTDRGDAHQHIPIWVPPGRAGIQPDLALEYSSGGGNGLAGAGWGVAGLPRITRCKSMRKNGNIAPPILWNEGDTFCLDGEPLVPDSDHFWYRKFHDDGSLIVRARTSMADFGYWLLYTKDGRILTFGGTANARVLVNHSLPASLVLSYALSRVEDRAGNFMSVMYEDPENGDILPQYINYTGSAADPTTRRSVRFVYELRPDVDTRIVAQQRITYTKRLKTLEMRAPNAANLDPLRTVSLSYTTSATTGRSLLSYIAECDGPAPTTIPVTGSTKLCRQQSLTYAPGTPITAGNAFDIYSQDSSGATIADVAEMDVEGVPPAIRLLDVNGDGLDDILYLSTDTNETYHLRMSTGTTFGPAINTGIPVSVPAHLPTPVRGTSAPIVLDFNGDGHADVLVNQGPPSAPVAHLYLANNAQGPWILGGLGYAPLLSWPAPSPTFNYFQSADINGDSLPDLLMMSGNVAYYSLNTNGTFNGLTTPAVLPMQTNADYLSSITNHFLDLNNDGVTEVMTKMWEDNACVTNHGDPTCDCRKMGYGALDIGANLYAGYYDASAHTATWVDNLRLCNGPTGNITNYTPLFGDFNGDGVVDVIQWSEPKDPNDPSAELPIDLTLLLGGGQQSFQVEPGGSIQLNPSGAFAFQTIDVDLDGKTDLLVRGAAVVPNMPSPVAPYTVLSWKNNAWQARPLLLGEDPGFYTATQNLLVSGDVNGDGVGDVVAYTGSGGNVVGKLVVYIRNTGVARADLLTSVRGDFLPATNVTYAPYRVASTDDRTDCAPPIGCVSRAGWLVSQVDSDNGIGAMNAQRHTFTSGRVDELGWGFLGFKTHKITDVATGAITTRTFDFSRITSGPTPFFPFLGLPVSVVTKVVYTSGATSVTRTSTTTNGYVPQGTGPFMTLPVNTYSTIVDSNVPTPIAESTTVRTFDTYGNMTFQKDIFSQDAEERRTSTTYLNDTYHWIIGRPTYVSTTSVINASITGGTPVTRETAYTYDALGQLAVQIDNPGTPNNGSYDPLPVQDDGVLTLYTKTTRDPNGLPTLVEKLDNLTAPTQRRATTFKYDAAEGMYVVQTTDPVGLIMQSAYEPGLGVLAAQKDTGRQLTTYQYDTFGRIRADHPAAGGDRIVAYDAATTGNFGTIDDHRLGTYGNKDTLDSLRRTVATTKTGRGDNKPVSTETTFDALGRVRTTTRPHFAGISTGQTTTTYDNLGRVTQIAGADGSILSTVYVGRQVTTTNPDGNMSTVTNDSIGRPVTSVQATTTGPAGLSGHVTTTTLGYGNFDTLVSSTDSLGNIVRRTYDRYGRLLWKNERDTHATALTYNLFGEVTDQVRGGNLVMIVFGGKIRTLVTGGTRTVMTYDADGRLKTKTAPDIAQTFDWDTIFPGKLSSASITGGTSIAYTYDLFGNVATKTWNGPRGPIGYTYRYDSYNRPLTTTYPAFPTATPQQPALVVRNVYSGGDVGGQLLAVNDVTTATVTPYWTLTSTDPSEAFSITGLRNGIVTTLGEDTAHRGWLKTITSKIGTTNVQALTYVREGAGRVHERDDTLNGTVEIFGYDGLERLTSSSWTGAAGTRSVQYVYDDIGNLMQRNITAGPGTSVTYTYGSSVFGPHQVASDGTTTAFAYDAQGNQLVAPGRTFAFNSFDRPTSVTASTGTYPMTYDVDLSRFSRTDPTGVVRYSYGGAYDEFTDTAGTHYVMTVSAAGHPVAEVVKVIKNNVIQSSATNTILVDALGSVDVLVGSNGIPEAIKYDPFGSRVKASDPTIKVKTPPRGLRAGFTGHNHDDDVNLIDMIGRVYDPQQQRFLSADPPDPSPIDSQAYNPYSYVRNNPLNATDPTGYLEVMLGGIHVSNDGDPTSTYAMGYAPGATYVYSSNFWDRDRAYASAPALSQGSNGNDGPSLQHIEPARFAGSSSRSEVEITEFTTTTNLFKNKKGQFKGKGQFNLGNVAWDLDWTNRLTGPDIRNASCFGQACAQVWSTLAAKHRMFMMPEAVRTFWGTTAVVGLAAIAVGLVIEAAIPAVVKGAQEGPRLHTVYFAYGENGAEDVTYIGRTINFDQRLIAQFAQAGRQINPIIDRLTYPQARGVEQQLFELYRPGGLLTNVINGISPRAANYSQLMEVGRLKLQSIGWPGF